MAAELLGGVELGGTKCLAVVARGATIIDRIAVPTTTPAATLPLLARWLGERRSGLAALGVASFGPVRVASEAPDHGLILDTPKPDWSHASVLAPFEFIALPTRLDTDVNAAALAELAWGAGQGASSLVYLTMGTGIGTGVLIGGQPVHGRLHPEGGHLRLGPAVDGFAGACPFHGDCVEGLLGGPALAQRFGCDPATVAPDDPRWSAPATDLARFLSSLLLLLAPDRILLGGSVALGQPGLVAAALDRVPLELGGYLGDLDRDALRRIVRPAALGSDAGPLGAVRLAQLAIA
jgi:fructokinase